VKIIVVSAHIVTSLHPCYHPTLLVQLINSYLVTWSQFPNYLRNMADEIYKKVGRGGAGNYYTKKDIEDLDHQQKDLEAQTPSLESAAISASDLPSPPSSEYHRTGRGGAGNYVPASNANALDRKELTRIPSAGSGNAKVQEKIGSDKTYRGTSGRGGAGNWRQTREEEERRLTNDEEEKKMAGSLVQQQVREDVERGLQMPSKAYLGPRIADG